MRRYPSIFDVFLYLFLTSIFNGVVINTTDCIGSAEIEIFRRLRFGKGDIYLGGINLTSAWVGAIENNPENVPALSVDNGVVVWKDTVREKAVAGLQVQLNLARKTRPRTGDLTVAGAAANQPDLFCRLALGSNWNTLGEFRGWKILLNPYPLDKDGHFTIIPAQETPAEHRDQILTSADIGFALTLLEESANLSIFYNDWGAGASQNHFH
ncbi:MAG: DUF4922 domain-containing protein, partial [Candidatus Omnitrophica bacterium]|nr:DUF4922 domain-containing protein [Candidatus Omnitrophota bacterium]